MPAMNTHRIENLKELLGLLQPAEKGTTVVIMAYPSQMKVLVCYASGKNLDSSYISRHFDLSDTVYQEALRKGLITNNPVIKGVDEHLQFTVSERRR